MRQDGGSGVKDHKVVSHEEWLSARTAFLAREKEFTRLRDDLNRQRRELPWERVEKPYVFDEPSGKQTLVQLFGKRSQLVVYDFMFSPDWNEGCPHCSFWADNFSGIDIHLDHRDVSFVVVSRAPLAKIEPFKKRMGWSFKWVSSFATDFNYDYQASFTPEETRRGAVLYNFSKTEMDMTDREGVSAFYKDGRGAVFHTYSCYARGIDLLNTAYNFLDLAPKRRDEDRLEWSQAWVRHHDGGHDASVARGHAAELPSRRSNRVGRDPPGRAHGARGRRLLLRVGRVRGGGVPAGRRPRGGRDALVGHRAFRSHRDRRRAPARRMPSAHVVEIAPAPMLPGGAGLLGAAAA